MPDRPGLISVVGGESTGKSTLAAALGSRLPAVVVPEFLRGWVDQHEGRVPGPDEQEIVMSAHRQAELSALREANLAGQPWVVTDSGPLMTAVYSVQYYGDTALLPRAVEWLALSDWVVWCQDDFPWQPDPQRDGANARATSQQILAGIFADQPQLPMLVVAGSSDERLEAVLNQVSSR